MYTIDASVWVNAFDRREIGHQDSRRFFELLHALALPVLVPNLVAIEVAGAIRRTRGESKRAREFAAALSRLPNVELVPLDHALAQEAWDLAAEAGLRGADAVYAAVALRADSVLVSLDNEHLKRLADVVTAITPTQALARVEAASG